ncbi:MAG TPA: DJ-1/PfpI family protein [Intrasporangium sp.]|uniref:GlxA family transcriptional regulator n=1 Tax=Intrasporangium sp. TaxID=1925024 RepID=UPI002B463477|nr:DJ-1/PfpI family protein [Intrasporangium sp.]HKX65622.1 DJ-1/PfpI family protein [Intrasporangium sp.]
MPAPRRVVFALPGDLHLLDVAGPAQAFSMAAELGADYDLVFVGDEATTRSRQGLGVTAGTEWPLLAKRDLVVVPGWSVGQRDDGSDEGRPVRSMLAAHLGEAVGEHHRTGGEVASVCAGAFALAAAGVLDGRRATTHHALQASLARWHPTVTVVPDVLYVSDGLVHTSAGISSGIDLALHLIARDHGPALAARVARGLVVPMRRNGTAPQESVMLQHRDHMSDLVHRAQDVLDAEFGTQLGLADLARRLAVSERTLTRAFAAATGVTPHRYQTTLRVERAQVLLASGWSQAAAAQEVGLGDARSLRRLLADQA